MTAIQPAIRRPHPFTLSGAPRRRFVAAALIGIAIPLVTVAALTVAVLHPSLFGGAIWAGVPLSIVFGGFLAGLRSRILEVSFSRQPVERPPWAWQLLRASGIVGLMVGYAAVLMSVEQGWRSAVLVAFVGAILLGSSGAAASWCLLNRQTRQVPGLSFVALSGAASIILAGRVVDHDWPLALGTAIVIAIGWLTIVQLRSRALPGR